MTSLKNVFFIALLLLVNIISNGQEKPYLKLITSNKDFKIQERVILMPDQDFYLAGETVNYFATTIDAGLQIPIEFSSILYLELFDQNNNVILAKKILLKRGEAIGTVDLPRDMKTGYYFIRAYTNYMKNFGPSAFFTKRLKIVNPFLPNNISNPEEAYRSEVELGVVSEGNNLLYNIENRIVFYSSHVNERILARLYINDMVAAQAEAKNGIGSFSFIPVEGNSFRIEAVTASGKIESAELKNVSHSGVICKLDSIQSNNCFLKIVSKNYIHAPLKLFAENNGIEYEYSEKITDSVANLQIQLPAGLNKIIVKDTALNKVCERLIYIKPKANFEIIAHFNKTEAPRGDSVVLNIQSNTDDSIQYLVALNLGNEYTSPPLQDLIESSLFTSSVALLTNNVGVNYPDYLGNDWKIMNDYILRFQHSGATINKLSNIRYLPEISQDFVTGSVQSQNNQPLAANKNLYLAFIDSICWLNRAKTDSSGRFTATLPINFQGNELVVSLLDTVSDYTVTCDDEFYPDFLKVTKEDFYPDSSLKSIIEARMINLQINDAYDLHKANKKQERPVLRFYGYPNSEYKFSKYLNLPNLEEFVFEVVKEAVVKKKGTQVNFKVITGKNDISDGKPLIILDGIPLLEPDNLSPFISTEKLESIRMVSSRFFFGSEVFDGIIDITSNDKSFNLAEKDKNSARVRFSPVITTSGNNHIGNFRMVPYISNIYFSKINSSSGKEEVKIPLPQNTGSYSITLFGYKKNGDWGYVSMPSLLKIK